MSYEARQGGGLPHQGGPHHIALIGDSIGAKGGLTEEAVVQRGLVVSAERVRAVIGSGTREIIGVEVLAMAGWPSWQGGHAPQEWKLRTT